MKKETMELKGFGKATEEELIEYVPHVLAKTKSSKIWIETIGWCLDPEAPEALNFKRYEIIKKALIRMYKLGYTQVDADAFQGFLKEFNQHDNGIVYKFNRAKFNTYVEAKLLNYPKIPILLPPNYSWDWLNEAKEAKK